MKVLLKFHFKSPLRPFQILTISWLTPLLWTLKNWSSLCRAWKKYGYTAYFSPLDWLWAGDENRGARLMSSTVVLFLGPCPHAQFSENLLCSDKLLKDGCGYPLNKMRIREPVSSKLEILMRELNYELWLDSNLVTMAARFMSRVSWFALFFFKHACSDLIKISVTCTNFMRMIS